MPLNKKELPQIAPSIHNTIQSLSAMIAPLVNVNESGL